MHSKNTAWLRWSFDPQLVLSLVLLMLLGLVMVTSASMVVAQQRTGSEFHYVIRHAIFLFAGILTCVGVRQLPMAFWQRTSPLILFGMIGLLILVLIPGIGKTINGSSRWIDLGILSLQVSEIAKVGIIIFLAGYIVRHEKAISAEWIGFLKPLGILGVISVLLLLEPDFGATVVILATGLGMLFLAGVPFKYFFVLGIGLVVALTGIMLSAPYRIKRLTSFLDPWAYQYDSGYQLTQALIAFGRGEWFGVGIGASVQKLFYLPEAYTDFVFAVLAEELGLMGALSVVVLFGILVYRGIQIGMLAEQRDDRYSAFISYGITFWVGLQALVNMGVNTGLLPTKGLTLPFLSYGGSSLLMLCFAFGLMLRIDKDNRTYFRREAGFV